MRFGNPLVLTADIADGAITALKLADGAVTEPKLGAGAVTEPKLGAGSVVSAALASASVIADRIADEAVGSAKLATSIQSDNFDSGIAGWFIGRASGSAEFNDVIVRGTIFANAGEIGTLNITGVLTMTGSGAIRTASSGPRVELANSGNASEVELFFGSAAELAPPAVQGFGTDVGGDIVTLHLTSGRTLAGLNDDASILMTSAKGAGGNSIIGIVADTIGLNGASVSVGTLLNPGDLGVTGQLAIGNTAGFTPHFRKGTVATSTIRIQTASGYTEIGSNNNSWSHMYTDRAAFWFNKGITVDTGLVDSYNEDLNLRRAASNTNRHSIQNGIQHFWSGASIKLTIDDAGSGRIGIGDTTPDASVDVFANSADLCVQLFRNTSTSTADIIEIRSNVVSSNRIQSVQEADGDWFNRNGTYGVYSDRNLKVKSTIRPARDYSDDLRAFVPARFRLKRHTEHHLGYVADDVEKVKPGLVKNTTLRKVTRGGLVRKGHPKYAAGGGRRHPSKIEYVPVKALKQGLLIPMLHSGWLAHDRRLATLEAELDAVRRDLQSTVAALDELLSVA